MKINKLAKSNTPDENDFRVALKRVEALLDANPVRLRVKSLNI
jgi:hypothetical protein